jgi:glucose/arabinose dehydrogenase
VQKLIIFFTILFSIIVCQFKSNLVGDGFTKPIFVQGFPNDLDKMMVIEQNGILKILNLENGKSEVFMDITDRVHIPKLPGDERGLLGFTFSPDYEKSHSFYVNYVNKENETIISRFSTNEKGYGINNSEEIILQFLQPYSNHNGGMLAFNSKDGCLYISVGDGGDAGDPQKNGQNIETLFGTILRIDVSGKSKYTIPVTNPFARHSKAKREIWAYGLRNPWRFSFDRLNGDLYIADVGQNTWEEINYQSFESNGGENYGWNNFEGNHQFEKNEELKNTVFPIFEYSNDANYMKVLFGWDEDGVDGCSVTGGYVYRGKLIPEIYGHYFFSDYCSGNIWGFKVENDKAIEFKDHTKNLNIGDDESVYISSFGEDANGELYIIDYNGSIYKLVK